MLASDVYHPAQWHDFFVMVGGAAAVLIGLVFVAMSINLHELLPDVMHRARSIGTLTNFAGVTAGLYVAAGSMTVLTVYSVTGAWLLVLGARSEGRANHEGGSCPSAR